MNRFFQTVAALYFLSCLSGCVCDREKFGVPNLLHPGHISEQRSRMERFDPFTRTDIGPKVEGDRPRGSQEQTPTPQHFKEYPSQGY